MRQRRPRPTARETINTPETDRIKTREQMTVLEDVKNVQWTFDSVAENKRNRKLMKLNKNEQDDNR